MNIYFKNESDHRIILTLNGLCYSLRSGEDDIYPIDSNSVKLTLTTDNEYSFETFSEKRGMTLYHRFITVAHYDFMLDKDIGIFLKTETVRGNNLESYQRVVPSLKGGFLPEAFYTMKNKDRVKEKLRQDEQKLDKFEKKANKWSNLLGFGLWLEDAFAVIGGIFLALILIYIIIVGLISFPIPTVIVLSLLLIVGTLGWKILKKVFSFAFKSFEKLLNRHGDKAADAFSPCGDMPEGLYKDDNSYFDNEYISAVFKHSTRRKQ